MSIEGMSVKEAKEQGYNRFFIVFYNYVYQTSSGFGCTIMFTLESFVSMQDCIEHIRNSISNGVSIIDNKYDVQVALTNIKEVDFKSAKEFTDE